MNKHIAEMTGGDKADVIDEITFDDETEIKESYIVGDDELVFENVNNI